MERLFIYRTLASGRPNELYKKWDELDSFEGEEYRRVLTKVILNDANSTQAYIYELNQK